MSCELLVADHGLRVVSCGRKGYRAKDIVPGEKDQKRSGRVRIMRIMNDELRMTTGEGKEKTTMNGSLSIFVKRSQTALRTKIYISNSDFFLLSSAL